jgi:alpha-galactosidase
MSIYKRAYLRKVAVVAACAFFAMGCIADFGLEGGPERTIEEDTHSDTDVTSDTENQGDTLSDSDTGIADTSDTGDDGAVIPDVLPDPDDTPPDTAKPVKIYILSGQSNMVGMGEVSGGNERYAGYYVSAEPGAEQGLMVSVYDGPYDPAVDYDSRTPVKTQRAAFGGDESTWPTYSGAHTDVARGYFEAPTTGEYTFEPGYGDSTYNVMELDGKEVYRRNLGEDVSVHKNVSVVAGRRYAVKLTYFKQGSCAAWMTRQGIPGTLDTVTRKDGLFPYLVDDNGNWTVRNDVWYKGVVTATANKWLTVGCGSSENTIGPELGFGHVMGYYHDEPVIIIKASQGNRSLGWDLLPPGSERYTVDGVTYAGYGDKDDSWSDTDPYTEVDWYAGKQYDDFVSETKKVLENFSTLFPQWADQGYEIAGFVWFQGHKDTGSDVHADRYELNLVNFIKAFRKDLSAPDAPFVIATIGFHGWEMSGNMLKVAQAQLAVSGETGKYSEFKGNVLTVETRDFWRDESVSPKGQDYHYNRNAETFMLVGEALGRGMVDLKWRRM